MVEVSWITDIIFQHKRLIKVATVVALALMTVVLAYEGELGTIDSQGGRI